MHKKERLDFICDLVSRYQIDTQEEIVRRLQEAGIKATQATVSRDIKTLGIVKVPTSGRSYVYGLPKPQQEPQTSQQRYVYQARSQGSMLHLDVEPGTATVVKQRLMAAFPDQFFSVISDDDSLLIVLKTGADSAACLRELREW